MVDKSELKIFEEINGMGGHALQGCALSMAKTIQKIVAILREQGLEEEAQKNMDKGVKQLIFG